jgi:hypothetical protein
MIDVEDKRYEIIVAGKDINKVIDLDVKFMSDWTTETMVDWLRSVGTQLEAGDKLQSETWDILRSVNALSEELQKLIFKEGKKTLPQEKAVDIKVGKVEKVGPVKKEKKKKEPTKKTAKPKSTKPVNADKEKDAFGFTKGTKPSIAIEMLCNGKTMADVKDKLGTEYYLVLKKAKELGHHVEKRVDGTYIIGKQVA